MQKIKTKDNSVTFLSKQYNETYHSISGAKEEAVKKFVDPCKFLFNKKHLDVLDICFGLGYNSAALIDNYNGSLNIIALICHPTMTHL